MLAPALAGHASDCSCLACWQEGLWDDSDLAYKRHQARMRGALGPGDVQHSYGVKWRRGASDAEKAEQWRFAISMHMDPSHPLHEQRMARANAFWGGYHG